MSDPFALLVDAANAKSNEEASSRIILESPADRSAHAGTSGENKVPRLPHLNLTETDYLHGALQHEVLEREAVERDMMQLHTAYGGMGTLGNASGGGGRLLGIGAQEADYLQQLRLEALVQQSRQETLAQLAFAQEMDLNPHMLSFAQADQLRRAALLRQEMMLHGGFSAHRNFGGGHPLTGLSERTLVRERELNEERLRKEQYEQQQHLASLRYGAGRNPGLIAALANKGRPDNVVSNVVSTSTQPSLEPKQVQKAKHETVFKKEDEQYTIVPCPARGLPAGHNSETAYFKITSDVKHGTPLVCSFYACRNSGAQFNYCSTCNIPVSKWNFKKLHNHKQPPSLNADQILAQLVERGAKEIYVPGEGTKPPSRKMTLESRRLLDSRREQWEKLLQSRPKSIDSLDEWVRQVLAVSDIDSELPILSENTHPSIDKNITPTIRKLIKKRALPINGSKPKNSDGKSLPTKNKNLERPSDVDNNYVYATQTSYGLNKIGSEGPEKKEKRLRTEDASNEADKSQTAVGQKLEIRICPVSLSGVKETESTTHSIPDESLKRLESPEATIAKDIEILREKSLAYESDSGLSSSDDSVDLRATKLGK